MPSRITQSPGSPSGISSSPTMPEITRMRTGEMSAVIGFRSFCAETFEHFTEPPHLFAVSCPIELPLRLDGRLIVTTGLIDGSRKSRVTTSGFSCDRRRASAPSSGASEQIGQRRIERLLHHRPILVRDDDPLELGDPAALRLEIE